MSISRKKALKLGWFFFTISLLTLLGNAVAHCHLPSFFNFGFLALIYACLLEYWIHRDLMHYRIKWNWITARDHVKVHHPQALSFGDFFDKEHTPYGLSRSYMWQLFFLHCPAYAAIYWYFGPWASLGSILGSGGYLLQYEWWHWVMHHHPDHWLWKIPYFRWVTELHRIHHYTPDKNFNVGLPVGDLLFGTFLWVYDMPPEPTQAITAEQKRSLRRSIKEKPRFAVIAV